MRLIFAHVAVVQAKGEKSVFEYLLPEELEKSLQLGSLVLVPLRKQRSIGIVVDFTSHSILENHREIIALLGEEPLIYPYQIELLNWMSRYYFSPLSECLKLFLPPGGVPQVQEIFTFVDGNCELKGEKQREVALYVKERGTVSADSLKSVFGPSFRSVTASLKRKGILKTEFILKKPRVNPRKEILVFPLKKDSNGLSGDEKEVFLKVRLRSGESLKHLLKEGFSEKVIRSLREKGFLEFVHDVRRKKAHSFLKEEYENITPTEEQNKVVSKVLSSLKKRKGKTFLLQGVTGSGKTETYILMAEKALEMELGVIVIVPEISLTPQLAGRFRKRLGEEVTVLHSALTLRERFDQWWGLKKGDYKVVIGARSAIFAPLKNPGLIILDEEHETSYKQNRTPRYHAREVALKLSEITGATVVLGSATPSIETRYLAEKKVFTFLSLKRRFGCGNFPNVEIVDMKEEKGFISERLREEIDETLKKREKALLFLNRRGFSPFLICLDCGTSVTCPYCAVSLVYHKREGKLLCHHCNFKRKPPGECESCGSYRLSLKGVGTEKVEIELKETFPEAFLIRMDRDTVAGRESHKRLLQLFLEKEKSILLGTQMVAKGLDFPDITLVGILNADTALNLPDFRAEERTFQLIMQAGGRAGRGNLPGRVIIQTLNPKNPAILSAASGDYESFYRRELEERKELHYPPFKRLVRLVSYAKSEKKAEELLKGVVEELEERKLNYLGPSPAPLQKLQGYYRYHLTIKIDPEEIRKLDFLKEKVGGGSRVIIDVDPVSML